MITNKDSVKKWIGLVSQSGTNAPTAIVLYNSLGQDVVFSRVTAGSYRAIISNLEGITEENTTVTGPPLGIQSADMGVEEPDSIYFRSFNGGVETDGIFFFYPLEITIYGKFE